MAAIYVSTYARYNSGSLYGKWVELDFIEDESEFWEVCREIHKGETDPEFMCQDFEGFPRELYQESGIHPDLFDFIKFDDDHGGEVKDAYLQCFSEWDREKCQENFYGEFTSLGNFAMEYLDETGFFEGARPEFEQYFDFESYGRDMEMNGTISEHNGFYFWR